MGKMMMTTTQPDDDVHLHHHHHHPTSSSSSSIDSNTESSSAAGYYSYHHHHHHHHHHSNSLSSPTSSLSSTNLKDHHHLNTHLFLGLSLSHPSSSGGQYSDWPPIKAHLRNTLAAKSKSKSKSSSRPRERRAAENSLFVKVYREGIPIGRKLDLLSIHGYHSLISTLSLMFQTTILYPDVVHHKPSEKCHILTYEDKDGDWMMVGDVPWEMFLTVVKRLKIATPDTCQ